MTFNFVTRLKMYLFCFKHFITQFDSKRIHFNLKLSHYLLTEFQIDSSKNQSPILFSVFSINTIQTILSMSYLTMANVEKNRLRKEGRDL